MNISENLKRLRTAKKLSQVEMAKLLGFKSHNAYSHWEVGKTSPNVRDLDRLAEILGASVQNILFGDIDLKPVPGSAVEVNTKIEELETEIRHLKRENMLLQLLAKEKGVEFPKPKAVTFMPKKPTHSGGKIPRYRLFSPARGSRFGSQPFAS